MSQTKMKNDKQKTNKNSGGYNVAWLILVQAAAWNVLFPVYLFGGGVTLIVGLIIYLTAMMVVAKKTTEPTLNYSSMSSEELQKEIAEFNARYEEYKLIPSRIKMKLRKTRAQKNRVEPLLQTTLVQ